MHDGRPIRVQLRDRNPAQRGIWRAGRGRTRAFFGLPPHGQNDMSAIGISSLGQHLDGTGSPVASPHEGCMTSSRQSHNALARSSPTRTAYSTGEPRDAMDLVLRTRSWQDGLNASTSASSISSGTTKVPSIRYEVSHGPPSTSASSTPPPSSSSEVAPASSAVPMAPYMNMGFLPPQSWVPPYPSTYPYPFPVAPGYGYVGYPYAPIPTVPPQAFPREGVPSNAATGAPWTGAIAGTASKVISTYPLRPTHTLTSPPLNRTAGAQMRRRR